MAYRYRLSLWSSRPRSNHRLKNNTKQITNIIVRDTCNPSQRGGEIDRRRQLFVCIPIPGTHVFVLFSSVPRDETVTCRKREKTNLHAGKQVNEDKTRNNVQLINCRKPIPRFQCPPQTGQVVNR